MTLQGTPSTGTRVRPSMIDLLMHHAQTQSEKTAFVFIGNDGQEAAFTFAQVLQETARYAHWMRTHVSLGDRVLLALDTGPEYVFSFLGALASGVVPVPLFPPEPARKHHMTRLISVIADAEPALILTDGPTLATLRDLTDVRILEASNCPANDRSLDPQTIAPDDLAFLQYTSGSTSAPKGVMVSHDNIVANSYAMIAGADITSEDVCVTWLPIYHDMGLIGNILMPLVAGIKTISMSPKRFLMRPERWLKAISDHRGTVSGAPDFAYLLCTNVVRKKTLSPLDLSTWRVAFSGSEPIRFSTLQQFSDRFAGAGFRNETFLPCYGLAEATLAVTGIPATDEPSQTPVPGASHIYVNCGGALTETEIRIGATDFNLSVSTEIGEIYVTSPSVSLGYWRNPTATANTFRTINGTRWLRTGDLGFLSNGNLHVTGRAKDLIIVSGQNIYPQDIEAHVEATHLNARNGRVAAYATQHSGSEGFGLALEVSNKSRDPDQLQYIGQTIAADLAKAFQIAPVEIVFLPPHALPRTSSGKLQRSRAATLNVTAPDQVLHTFTAHGAAPTRPLALHEISVAVLWSETLDQPVTDPDANFFVLGGSSIQALRLASKVEKQFGVVLPTGMLFADPTLKTMAAAIETGERAIPIPICSGLGSVRLGGLGLYFWLLDCFGFGGVCHVCCGVSFEAGGGGSARMGPADLRAALARVVRRQQALRLSFLRTSDGVLSVSAVPPEQAEVALRQLDLSDLAPSVAQARLDNLSELDATDRLDLLDGPGWRATLVQMPQDRQVLLLTLHHIMCDGWSMGLLQNDLLAALRGDLDDTPLQPSYLDVQQWQEALSAAGAGRQALEWWTEAFDHRAPAPLELPTDRPRPAQRSWRGGRVEQHIPAALADRLRQLARAQGATLQQVLMAGWCALLHRLSGQTNLCIGLPVAGRPHAEMQPMVGLFVNTLPLPVQVDPRQGFGPLLTHLRDQAAGAMAHQDVALDQLTQQLRGEAGTDADSGFGAKPLFDVVHAHQPAQPDSFALPGGQLAHPFARSNGAQQFDLALETIEAADGPIVAALGYDADLFHTATPTRWLQAWIDLLEHGVTAPDQALDLIPLLAVQEQQRLSAPWPDSLPDRVTDALIPDQIAAQDPDRIALILEGAEMTYGALNARANQIAHALTSHLHMSSPATHQPLVGICLTRSLDAIAACLGVMRAGAAFVPLDPTHPADRRAHILRDCNAACLIGQPVEGVDLPLLDHAATDSAPTTAPAIQLTQTQLAYVIYTSGSTGAPKGVAVEHGPLAMHIAATAAAYEMSPECRELHMLSLAFDGAHERWMVPLSLGGTLVLRPDILWSGAETLDALEQHAITNAGFPTALLHQVAEAATGITPPPVQMYSFGGEAMPRASFDLIAKTLAPQTMINGYGPTECVISPMIWKAKTGTQAARFDTPNAPIGRPVGQRRAYVLDARMRPVLLGQPGELYLAGGLARGYLNRPGQTAQVFVPDPFGAPGCRMYRTGDRVRQRPDGVIEYLGRADRQIKLRGYRIEPAEVEARLNAFEDVAQSHVMCTDTPAGPLLAAWITPASGTTPDPAQLQNRIAKDLPPYMVPAHIEVIPAFPKTPNGKTDTKALTLTPKSDTPTNTETLTPTEQKIADIWAQITNEKPNKKSNFTKNNNSINAIKLVDSIRKAFPGRPISIADVFNNPTLEAIAACLEQDQTGGLSVVHLTKGRAEGPVYLFPGLMVNTREYAPLVRHLTTAGVGNRAITGFVFYSLDETRSDDTTITSLAEDYADYIITQNHTAPATFLGWSWGGILAYETARLLGPDYPISFVGMLDVCDLDVNFAAGALVEINPLQERALNKVMQDWLPRTKLRAKWEALFRKMDATLHRQFLRYVQTAAGQLPTDGPGIGSKEYELWTFLDNTLVYRQHQIAPADIPIHVWYAGESVKRDLSLVDWSLYSKSVRRIETIPGVTHRQIVDSPQFHNSFAQSLSGTWQKVTEDA